MKASDLFNHVMHEVRALRESCIDFTSDSEFSPGGNLGSVDRIADLIDALDAVVDVGE